MGKGKLKGFDHMPTYPVQDAIYQMDWRLFGRLITDHRNADLERARWIHEAGAAVRARRIAADATLSQAFNACPMWED